MTSVAWGLFLSGLVMAGTLAARSVPAQGGAERLALWVSQAGPLYCVGLLCMVSGGVLLRRLAATRPKSGDVPGRGRWLSGLQRLEEPLLLALTPDGRVHLEMLMERGIPSFLDSCDGLPELLGLEGFARFMGAFASFERNAARTWSALIDDARPEAERSFARAQESFAAAVSMLEALELDRNSVL